MLRKLTQQVLGRTTVHYQGSDYDFSLPFRRISVFDPSHRNDGTMRRSWQMRPPPAPSPAALALR